MDETLCPSAFFQIKGFLIASVSDVPEVKNLPEIVSEDAICLVLDYSSTFLLLNAGFGR